MYFIVHMNGMCTRLGIVLYFAAHYFIYVFDACAIWYAYGGIMVWWTWKIILDSLHLNTLLHRSTGTRNLCCTKHTGARLREQMMMMMMNQIECKNEKYFL